MRKAKINFQRDLLIQSYFRKHHSLAEENPELLNLLTVSGPRNHSVVPPQALLYIRLTLEACFKC